MPFSPRGIEQSLVLPPRWPLILYTGTLYRLTLHWTKRWTYWTVASIPNGIFKQSHTQAESASSVICASVLLNFAGYTSRSSHTPSSLLLIAPLVHPDKSGLSIQHHVEVVLSCRETLNLPVLRDLAGPVFEFGKNIGHDQIWYENSVVFNANDCSWSHHHSTNSY